MFVGATKETLPSFCQPPKGKLPVKVPHLDFYGTWRHKSGGGWGSETENRENPFLSFLFVRFCLKAGLEKGR